MRGRRNQSASPIFKSRSRANSNAELEPEYRLTANYWLQEFPRMDTRPRSSIVSLFTTLADCFLRGTLRKLFSSETTIVPEHTTLGRIIIVDLPVKEWSELGQYAGVLMKFMTQKGVGAPGRHGCEARLYMGGRSALFHHGLRPNLSDHGAGGAGLHGLFDAKLLQLFERAGRRTRPPQGGLAAWAICRRKSFTRTVTR
jgi:hypothetical protein